MIAAWSRPLVVSCLAVFAGCAERGSSAVDRPPVQGDVISLRIGTRDIEAEVVFDEAGRKRGLMHRESLPENSGMLFIFPESERRGFWMKNTLIPLSIAFIDDDGVIRQIEDMRPKDENSTRSNMAVRFALETNKGWFDCAGVGEGERIEGFRAAVARFPAR